MREQCMRVFSVKKAASVVCAVALAAGLMPLFAGAPAVAEEQASATNETSAADEGTTAPEEGGVPADETVTITLDFAGIDQSKGTGQVEVDGVAYPLKNGSVVLPKPADADSAAVFVTFSTYKQAGGANLEGNYATHLYVWSLSYDGASYTATRQTQLDDILQYAGCSIRISSNTKTSSGVRVTTSVPKSKKKALTGAGLCGFTLKEYGTVVKWDAALGEAGLTLDSGTSRAAYVKGSTDAVYKETDSLIKYTAVLTNFSGKQITDDLRMRPYMVLVDSQGKECVLYGSNLVRNIGYVASQNANVFNRGTAGYRYVWNLVHAKYGTDKDKALGYQPGTVCDYVAQNHMWQEPELPWGCESVSLGILLRAFGYDVGKCEIYDSYLTHSDWDFVYSFCGDAYNCTGLEETFPPAIVNAANRYLSSHGSKSRAYVITGASFDQLLDYLNQGYPVLVWTTMRMNYVGKYGMWQDGYQPYKNEHCVVMYGADGGIQVSDPISGNVTRDWGAFRSIYEEAGCYAAVIL